jgi:exodeoxyribonuclease VII large subunit
MDPLPLPTVYAVSELSRLLRDVLEANFTAVWVEGEISNLARPASGHWYFTLKDGEAQLRAAMFKPANRLVRPPPNNGDQVRVRARISMYPARGDLQLICEHMEPAGLGAKLAALEALKAQLQAEGLFDPAIKRPVPVLPRRIGLVTSATGAAVQDVMTTLARRFPLAPVIVCPVLVQGDGAAPAIAQALRDPRWATEVDVLLLVRGGGSIEDLWAFNEALVVRAVRDCAVPVITGVGHETDTTLVDLAADLRAPTPTGAAERAVPDQGELKISIGRLMERLTLATARHLSQRRQQLERSTAQLLRQRPTRRLQLLAQRLDDLTSRLESHQRRALAQRGQGLTGLIQRLARRDPGARLAEAVARHSELDRRLHAALQRGLATQQQRWQMADRTLQALSPNGVLARGFVLVRDAQGAVLTRAAQVPDRADLTLQFHDAAVPVRR